MQNLMIIDNNILHIQNVLDDVSENLLNVKLFSFFTTNDSKIYDSILNEEIDIIIINIESVITEVIEFISKNKLENYKNSIILQYKDPKILKKLLKPTYNKYIVSIIEASDDTTEIINVLRKTIFDKENTSSELIIKNKIMRELKKLKYNFEHIGTKYILECIYIVYINKIVNFNLTKQVYSVLSQKYHKSVNTIKCDITSATTNMYYECEEEFIMEYFGYLDPAKPEVKEVIETISEKI